MFKWMIRFYIFIFFLYLKLVNINCKKHKKDKSNINQNDTLHLVPKKVEILYLNYSKKYQFLFEDNNSTDNLLVHFHSIDCNIRFINNQKINEIKKNIFSVFIKKNEINSTKLLLEPFINSDNNDKTKELSECPIVINSLYINEFQIDIEEQKEYMAFNFNENLTYVNLLYQMKNLNDINFIILSFKFDEKYSFNVEINNNQTKSILNSQNIFLDNSTLTKFENNILNINISYIRNNMTEEVNNPVLIFSLFDSNSTSILLKNKLNIGYTISNKVKQYYYLKVFKDEEGEIMLHDKRFYGKLYGVIKENTSNISYYDTTEYIKEANNSKLKFDDHTLKLSFKSNETQQCEKGCYLFITYTHDNFGFDQTFGSELTLLVRTWNKEDIFPQIINIPFNEYIFGVFEEDSINHHFYSLSIPENTEEIIIQFEGSYIEGFIGEGKKKLNTFRKLDNIKNLNITENKMILVYNKTLLEELSININDSISFAFRPKNFFNKIYSFYSIRILFKENNTNRIYPLDPNLGNICIPEKSNNEEKFFCKCRLYNYYKELLSLDNYIAFSSQAINYNESISKEFEKGDGYLYKINLNENVPYIELIYYFSNSKIVYIFLSTFYNNRLEINPQIYSSEMFYLKQDFDFNFNLKHNFSLILSYIYGKGEIKYNDLNFEANLNFQKKPILFRINETNKKIYFHFNISSEEEELFFFIKLNYIIQKNEIKEINQGEALREIVRVKNLPIYYYLKCDKWNKSENMNINFRIINFKDKNTKESTDFKINGYLIQEEDFIKRMYENMEFQNLNETIEGFYDKYFKIGILDIKTKENTNYILIKIDSFLNVLDDDLLIEILAMSKKDTKSLLSINKYIPDIYNSNNNKTYLIRINKKYMEEEIKNILVEFIPVCKEMKLESETKINLEKDINYGMVQKYRITEIKDEVTLKVISPQNSSNCSYFLRYYYSTLENEIKYKLNEKFSIRKGKNNNDIILDFNKIEIIPQNKNINFNIFGFLYKYESEIKKKFINSSFQNGISIAQAKNITDSNFNLSFNNIKKYDNDDYIYYLQIKIFSREIKKFLNEEFLMYTLEIDLADIFKSYTTRFIIAIAIAIFIIIILIIAFFICIIKMKKKNIKLEEKVLAISFQTGNITENLYDINQKSKNDEDYENTFI